MRRMGILLALLAGVGMMVAAVATTNPVVSASDGGDGKREVVMKDDCDPTDLRWAATGGCLLEDGDVNVDEFNAFLFSPKWIGVIGHPAWWFDPGYLKIESGKKLKVKNAGGRIHTFTEVAQFGGGRVPPLNGGSTPAPECIAVGANAPKNLATGEKDVIRDLSEGNHRFMCCIHPWMRTLVKVKPER